MAKKLYRNDPCYCDSGLKFKRCHGDWVKLAEAKTAYTDKLNELIEIEQEKQK